MNKNIVTSLLFLSIITFSLLGKDINLSINSGDYWNHSFKVMVMKIKTTPQFAIWLEDINGNYISTLKVTYSTAKGDYKGPASIRESSLPIWSHKRNKKNDNGGYMPTKTSPLLDGITAASPLVDTTISLNINDSLKDYLLMVEINQSMDFNNNYKKTEANSVNGQPSLLYSAKITPQSKGKIELKLISVGEVTGKYGSTYDDTSKLTTAKSMVSSVSVTIN